MGRTKKRGGAKAHRKRVQARNARIKGQVTKMQNLWQEEMLAHLQSLRNEEGDLELKIGKGEETKISMGNVETPNADENTPLDIKL